MRTSSRSWKRRHSTDRGLNATLQKSAANSGVFASLPYFMGPDLFVYVSVVRRLRDDNAAMQEAGILPVAERINPALLHVERQRRESSLAVLIAAKDIGVAVAAAGDMLYCVGKIHAWWTWHAYS
jgi:hypothetical protein